MTHVQPITVLRLADCFIAHSIHLFLVIATLMTYKTKEINLPRHSAQNDKQSTTFFHMLLGVSIYMLFGVRTTLSPCSDRANLRVDCNYVLYVSSLTGQSFNLFSNNSRQQCNIHASRNWLQAVSLYNKGHDHANPTFFRDKTLPDIVSKLLS